MTENITPEFDILTFGSITLDIILQLEENQSIDLVENLNEAALTIPLGDKIPVPETVRSWV